MMARYLGIWALTTFALCVVLFVLCNLSGSQLPRPDAASARWVQSAWSAARSGATLPEAPTSARDYRGAGPTFVSLYAGGSLRARHVGDARLVDSVLAGIARFAKEPLGARDRAQLRVAVTTATAPVIELLPWLSTLSIVPLREGAAATLDGRTEYVLPDDLLERQLIDSAVAAPVPDLTFGTSLQAVRGLLGIALSAKTTPLRLQRVRVEPVVEPQPAVDLHRLDLEHAARESVAFILRHQHRSGRFTYIYDAHRDAEIEGAAYSFARHAGTMFFLARAAVQLKSTEAREGALRGLGYIQKEALGSCGNEEERLCVEQRGRVEFGASALTALACAELLQSGDAPEVHRVLTGLLAFLRAQQRPDGEMMHEYSRELQEPRDVQHMYYSGEAALALLTAYEQLHDARDLEAASRLMTHLTGAGWGFFGARYYYGEEHWTCQAVAKAAVHMPVKDALDFCVRWGRWQEKLQYRSGVTPWAVEGAFGVGPVLLPRVTTAASRVEALVPVYRVLTAGEHGRKADLHSTRELIERSLGLLLRMRWAPGPTHLFARPSAALGGMPSTEAELRSRVDMVQHAGSAFLVWADALAHLD